MQTLSLGTSVSELTFSICTVSNCLGVISSFIMFLRRVWEQGKVVFTFTSVFSLSSLLVIIARLAEVAVENSKADNLTKKKDIALALLEAYRNISECCILVT